MQGNAAAIAAVAADGLGAVTAQHCDTVKFPNQNRRNALMSSIYDKFAEAWVEHHFFDVHGSFLAAARVEMLTDLDYDVSKHRKALQSARRVLSMLRASLA
jgi:hypothetical protein